MIYEGHALRLANSMLSSTVGLLRALFRFGYCGPVGPCCLESWLSIQGMLARYLVHAFLAATVQVYLKYYTPKIWGSRSGQQRGDKIIISPHSSGARPHSPTTACFAVFHHACSMQVFFSAERLVPGDSTGQGNRSILYRSAIAIAITVAFPWITHALCLCVPDEAILS